MLISSAATPRVAASTVLHPFLRVTMVDINGNAKWNIFPGEPIRIRWSLTQGAMEKAPNSINIRFLIEGASTYQRDNVPLTDEGTGDQTEIIIPDDQAASTVYKFYWKNLTVEVNGESYETQAKYRFYVIPETVDASWWHWRVPYDQDVAWKDAYSLSADFTNKSHFARIDQVTFELSEVRSEDNPEINPCDYEPINIQIRNGIDAGVTDSSLSFNLKQDWTWFIKGANVIQGPLSKSFNYAVWFYFSDEYGNNYNGVCSERIHRFVRISDLKAAAAGSAISLTVMAAAAAAAGVAALLSIFGAIGAPAFFAAAAKLYGSAVAAGAVALDPPAPDPNYKKPVTVTPLPFTKWPDGVTMPQEIESLKSLLEIAANLLALENARTLTRARLMSAHMFNSKEAVAMHHQGYLRIEQDMVKAADELEKIEPMVQNQIETSGFFSPEKISGWMDSLAQSGFPSAVLEPMHKAGLDDTQINHLASLIINRPIAELVKTTGLLVKPLVIYMRNFVKEIQKERKTILAGEIYIQVPPRPETVIERSDYVCPEAPLRPRPRCR